MAPSAALVHGPQVARMGELGQRSHGPGWSWWSATAACGQWASASSVDEWARSTSRRHGHTGVASTTLTFVPVDTTRSRRKPAPANSSANSASVRSRPQVIAIMLRSLSTRSRCSGPTRSGSTRSTTTSSDPPNGCLQPEFERLLKCGRRGTSSGVNIRVSNGSFDPSKYDELVALTEDVAARMKNLPGFVSYHGTTISALGSTYTTKTDGQATGGAYSLMEEELWGDPTPLHRHGREEEAFYVMSGRLAVWADGTETIAEPGAFVLIPRGVAHAARRIGDDPARMLTLISPAGLQRFFESVVREGEEQLLAQPDRLIALANEFGSEILGDYPRSFD
jgi:mannose-6-phosphate isomerase-like protein (cupin superfamily)